MQVIKPSAYSYPVLPNARVTILGAGNVAKSVLLTASLLRPNIKFKVIARSARSAELVREFLNDLPKLDVEVVSLDEIPDLSNQLVILTIGEKTAKFSKKSRKESLFQKNQLLVAGMITKLRSSVVIVVTNPSTAITKYLVDQGIQAYGIGVANDQLRFNNQADGILPDHYLVGGHNFHELVLGSKHSKNRTYFRFTHEDYKNILSKQDKKKLSFKNFPNSLLDFKWDKLEKLNFGFPPEYRWYARQRIHSKFHNTTISCSLAILNSVCLFIKHTPIYTNFSFEMPLFFKSMDLDAVIGWPIDTNTMQPIGLAFEDHAVDKLKQLVERNKIGDSTHSNSKYYLTTPFGDSVLLEGKASFVHHFFQTRLAHLFSLSAVSNDRTNQLVKITIETNRANIDTKFGGYRYNWTSVPQHRGRNPQEHSDLEIQTAGTTKIVKFPSNDSIGTFEKKDKSINLFFPDTADLAHELRRLVRDEIGIPTMISRGARIFHAGLVTFKGITIMVVGNSGGGKTTAILSLLCSDSSSSYGSAERTLVWTSGKAIFALGVPESVTVFPGTLKQLAEFEVMVDDKSEKDDWNPLNKMRLQMLDIIQRTGAATIQREVSIDLIIEVSYDPNLPEVVSETVLDTDLKKRLLLRNDLTEEDPVRLSWLDWFPKSNNRSLYERIDDAHNPDIHMVKWSTVSGLKNKLIEIIALKKLNSQVYESSQLSV